MNARPPALAAVVCANGLGHFRRTVEILSRVRARLPECRVTVLCEAWQRQRAGALLALRQLEGAPGVTWVHGVTAPGVGWSPDPALYGDGRLGSWVRRLEASGALAGADVVVSDNLPQVLALRSDAVLQGSFLWSTVLGAAHPGDGEVAGFVREEEALLARHRPPALCVRGVAMPDLLRQTRAVELPWMCPDPGGEARPAVPGRVAVLGGATGAADACLGRAAASCGRLPGVALAVPAAGPRGASALPGAVPFGFAPEEFRACAAALCRPAMGTLHECIAYGLPMALAHEADNVEMAHNGRAVEAAGLGLYLGADPGEAAVVDALRRLLEGRERKQILAAMEAAPKDGYDRAASWLVERLHWTRRGAAPDEGV